MAEKVKPIEGNRKKKVLHYSLSIAGTLVVGIGAGLLAGHFLKPPIENATANASDYALSESYYQEADTALKKAIQGGTPLNNAMTPDQLLNIAFRNFGKLDMTMSIGIGVSSSIGGIKQEIQSATYHVGDIYFEESNSLGVVNIHDRMYQEGDATTTYWGEKSDYANHPKEVMSNADYAKKMGKNVSEGLVYIISPKTISYDTDLSGDGVSKITKTEDGYLVDIELATTLSPSGKQLMPGVTNYQKQMKSISGLKTYPPFHYCHLKATVDKEGKLISFRTHEKYDANMPIGPTAIEATCEGTLYTQYFSGGQYEIPSLNTQIDYDSYK